MAPRAVSFSRTPEPVAAVGAAPLRERILLTVLFVTMLIGSIAFIEPSPHDAMMGLLAVTCLIAGVRFDRIAALLLLLLVLWNAAGLVALMNALGNDKSVQ